MCAADPLLCHALFFLSVAGLRSIAPMGGAGGKGTEHHVQALMEKLNLTAEEEEMAAFSDEEDDGGGVGRTGTDRKGSFASSPAVGVL